jgi:hypothetical protein
MKLYTAFLSPLFLLPLGPNTLLKHLFSDTSTYVPASLREICFHNRIKQEVSYSSVHFNLYICG